VPVLVVLGARNLGGAILDRFVADGWQGAAVARSEDTLAAVTERGGLALQADASDPGELDGALTRARDELGGLDLVVNAVSASRATGGPFGGGPLAEADLEGFRGWAVAVAEQSFVFLSTGIRHLRAAGGTGTLIQVTGGSSRRAMPGKGAWAAGAFASRALVQAAAQELRGEGIHVALLAVDATIASPKTAEFIKGRPEEETASMGAVADAAAFLAHQGPRGMTHELVVTPAGDTWVP
jgi:3-oxoacyl-[acyl-carrier protein] reductase